MFYVMIKIYSIGGGAYGEISQIDCYNEQKQLINKNNLTKVYESEHYGSGYSLQDCLKNTGYGYCSSKTPSFPIYLIFSSTEDIYSIDFYNNAQLGYFYCCLETEFYILKSDIVPTYSNINWTLVHSATFPNLTTIDMYKIIFQKKYYLFKKNNNIYSYLNEDLIYLNTSILTENLFLSEGSTAIPTNLISNIDTVLLFKNTSNSNMTVKSIPKQITIISDNILLSDIHEIQSITLAATNQNTSTIKIAISPNDGNEWFAYKNEQWLICNDIATDGNTITEFNNITDKFNDIINLNDKKLKFKFYLNLNNVNDTLEIDKLSYKVDLKGIWRTGTEGNVKYVVDFTTNKTCQLKILEPGSYKINY